MINVINKILSALFVIIPREKGSDEYKFNVWNPIGLTLLFLFSILGSAIEGLLMVFKIPYDVFKSATGKGEFVCGMLAFLLVTAGSVCVFILCNFLYIKFWF